MEKTLGPEHLHTARSLNSLAHAYHYIGDSSKALPLYERALAIREKSFGKDHPITASSLASLANLYKSMGNHSKALVLFSRVLEITRKHRPMHPDTAQALVNIGMLCRTLRQYDKAIQASNEALEIYKKTLGTDHPETAKGNMILASILQDVGQHEKSLQLLEESLEIQKEKLGLEHPETLTTLSWRGQLFYNLGKYKEAIEVWEIVLDKYENTFGPQHRYTATTLGNLAVATYRTGDLVAARNYAARQIAARQNELESILTLDERSRLAWQARNLSYWSACVLRPEPLAQLVLRQKGVVLDSLLEDRSLAISAKHDPEGRAKLEQIATLRSRLAKIAFEQSQRQEAARIQEQIGLLQRELSKRASLGGRTRQSAEITLDAILPALSQGAALVDFIRFRDPKLKGNEAACYGAVVTGADGSPTFVRIEGATAIDRAIDALRSAITQGNEAEVESQTRFLSEKLWHPVARQIPEGSQRILICPDAKLNFLSFAALLESDGRFVAEKYPIAYVGSGRDLARQPSGSPNKTLALFANPTFDLSSSSSPAREMLVMRSAEADVFGTITLPPLPGTESEAKSLQSLAKSNDWQSQAALGPEATEASVRQVKKPGILHLATHGFYLNSTDSAPAKDSRGMSVIEASDNAPSPPPTPRRRAVDPMRASGVALAGAQSTLKSWSQRQAPDPENDGILTAEEVAALDLEGTWLVTLSACETGVGEARSGEGVFGLRRAFMIAGAENLLMTLWPVADATTAQIMADFYKGAFATGEAAGSLAKVQRDWLVKLRNEHGLLAAVRDAGPFAMVTMAAPSTNLLTQESVATAASRPQSKVNSSSTDTESAASKAELEKAKEDQAAAELKELREQVSEKSTP
jgi:CHAT domain-containing protein/Tfp pilus assembly protein PilF